jgi:hypothetical protein
VMHCQIIYKRRVFGIHTCTQTGQAHIDKEIGCAQPSSDPNSNRREKEGYNK